MRKKTTKRGLTTGEIEALRSIFGEDIQYDKVRILNVSQSWLYKNIYKHIDKKTSAMVPDGRMYFFNPAKYSDDFSREPEKFSFFVHEMTHIWQWQKSKIGYAKSYMRALNEAKGKERGYRGIYDYDLKDGRSFLDYNFEQQASIIEHYTEHKFQLSQIFNDTAAKTAASDLLKTIRFYEERIGDALPVQKFQPPKPSQG